MNRGETVMGVVGGVIVGYVVWLVAFSIAGDPTTMSRWSPIVLILSALFAVWAVLWGRQLQRRRNYALASFAFALPVLPVVLSLGVLARSYL
jgi:heme O synthase-like polyprenyltransferase